MEGDSPAVASPSGPVRWRGPRGSHLSALLVIALAFLMVPAPGVNALSANLTASHAAPSTPAATLSPAAVPSHAATSGLAGVGPNAPYSVNRDTVVRFAAASVAAGEKSHTTSAPISAAPNSGPSVQNVPRELPYIPTGKFTGFVANASEPTDFLSGVTVQAYPEQGGQFCPSYLCSPQTTGSNGEFNVTCPVGGRTSRSPNRSGTRTSPTRPAASTRPWTSGPSICCPMGW